MNNKLDSKVAKQRLWIVTEVFYPEEVATSYILTEVALKLAKGIEVHIICGPKSYEKVVSNSDDSKISELQIHRVNHFNYNKNKLLSRLLRITLLSITFFFYGLFKIKRTDKVLIVTNPATIIPLFAFLKKIIGFEYFVLVHDVFPENLVIGGIVSGKNPFYKLLKFIFDFSYKAANKLVVLGRDMQILIHQKTKMNLRDIKIIPNWADLENVFPIPFNDDLMLDTKSKIVIQYAGNLGRLQNLTNFITIIGKVKNENLHFVFVGRGALEQSLRLYAIENNIKNISFLKPFSRNQQNDYLNACHIGLVSLTDELIGHGVPSKTYNILAAGKPVLFLGNQETEIAKLIKEEGCGFSFTHTNELQIINFLNNLKLSDISYLTEIGKKGHKIALGKYSKEIILEKFKGLLLENYLLK